MRVNYLISSIIHYTNLLVLASQYWVEEALPLHRSYDHVIYLVITCVIVLVYYLQSAGTFVAI